MIILKFTKDKMAKDMYEFVFQGRWQKNRFEIVFQGLNVLVLILNVWNLFSYRNWFYMCGWFWNARFKKTPWKQNIAIAYFFKIILM